MENSEQDDLGCQISMLKSFEPDKTKTESQDLGHGVPRKGKKTKKREIEFCVPFKTLYGGAATYPTGAVEVA